MILEPSSLKDVWPYAKRVRSLAIGSDTYVDPSIMIQLAQVLHGGHPLFKALVQLEVHIEEDTLAYTSSIFPVVLHPRIRHLTLEYSEAIDSRFTEMIVLPFLAVLPVRAPTITHFDYRGTLSAHSDIATYLMAYMAQGEYLTFIHLKTAKMDMSTLGCVSRRPALRELDVHTAQWTLKVCFIKHVHCSKATRLKFEGALSSCITIVKTLPIAGLIDVTISSPCNTSYPLESLPDYFRDWELLVALLSEHCGETLRTLDVNLEYPFAEFPITAIHRLHTFQGLSRLIYSAENTARLVDANNAIVFPPTTWRGLKHLDLYFGERNDATLQVSSLRALAEHCTDLQFLRIPLKGPLSKQEINMSMSHNLKTLELYHIDDVQPRELAWYITGIFPAVKVVKYFEDKDDSVQEVVEMVGWIRRIRERTRAELGQAAQATPSHRSDTLLLPPARFLVH